jgi:hypothetical protein
MQTIALVAAALGVVGSIVWVTFGVAGLRSLRRRRQ